MKTINQETLKTARKNYVKHVQDFWELLRIQGAERANRETEESSRIVEYCANAGAALDLLSPLLSHELETVRYAAAADLLNHETSEKAIFVLREIAENPEGFVAPTARLLLMKRRIPLAD